ncbi:hypothetical protein H0H93_010755, partial [Arthromyces matolae]
AEPSKVGDPVLDAPGVVFPDWFVNAKGQRRKIEDGHPGETILSPEPHAKPLATPEWLDFKIGDPPAFRSSNDPNILRLRASIVKEIEHERSQLKGWLENGTWLRESQIYLSQLAIESGLRGLTKFDLEEASFYHKAAYKPVILNRMLLVIQMHETTLSWGWWNEKVQKGLAAELPLFGPALCEVEGKSSTGYENLFHNLEGLTTKIKADLADIRITNQNFLLKHSSHKYKEISHSIERQKDLPERRVKDKVSTGLDEFEEEDEFGDGIAGNEPPVRDEAERLLE